MTDTTRVVVGVDVAKATLDVAVRPSDAAWTFANDEAGIRGLVAQLQAVTPAQIVLEATGGYEIAVVSALAVAGLPVIVVNPRAVRDFARATGQLAKTDQLDAGILARFAEQVRPAARLLADAEQQELDALLTRRRQLIDMLTAEKRSGPGSSDSTLCSQAGSLSDLSLTSLEPPCPVVPVGITRPPSRPRSHSPR